MENKITRNRISFLNVPLDILSDEELENKILSMVNDGGYHQIIFLRLSDLLKARRNNEFRNAVLKASLVIPISKSIISGASFLKKNPPNRFMPFEFIIKVLGILENHRKSVYLFGSKPHQIQQVTRNINDSFPGLKIVGRYSGFIKKGDAADINLAIKKAAPSLLLGGRGIKGHDLWYGNNRRHINSGIFIWNRDFFDITLGKKRKVSRQTWNSGMEAAGEIAKHPWRVFKGVFYIGYLFLLLVYKMRKL